MSTRHKIYIGDAETVLKKLPDNFFQLMVTSPPYWNVRDYEHKDQIGRNDTLEEYLDKLHGVWQEVARTLLPDGKIALNIGNIYYSEPDEKRRTTANLSLLTWQQLHNITNLRFMGTIYWQKTTSRNGAVLFGSYPYPTNFMISNAVEPIHIFRKTGKREVPPEIKERSKVTLEEHRKFRDAIWNDINGVEDAHCAAYPLELPARLIKMFSYVEDWVLDPFLGSGTTMKAAKDLVRNSVGIELNPDYLTRIEEKVAMGVEMLQVKMNPVELLY
ncbi:MAG: site-specific DNA-methyltransferase [Chloroflexi bacterium]|nr:site-specific DNA-methyltransferase [Chloroflexota bacterium]MBI3040625.1 site-specific DNA-methyltransferase [Chloroflexota bacterium]